MKIRPQVAVFAFLASAGMDAHSHETWFASDAEESETPLGLVTVSDEFPPGVTLPPATASANVLFGSFTFQANASMIAETFASTSAEIFAGYRNALGGLSPSGAGELGRLEGTFSIDAGGSDLFSASAFVEFAGPDGTQTHGVSDSVDFGREVFGSLAGSFSIPILAGGDPVEIRGGVKAEASGNFDLDRGGSAFATISISYAFVPSGEFLWQGDESSVFGLAGNWAGNVVPGADNVVRLGAGNSSLTFGADAASLALRSPDGGSHQMDLGGRRYVLGANIGDGRPSLAVSNGSQLTVKNGTIDVQTDTLIGGSGGASSLTLDDEATLDSAVSATSIFLGRSGNGALTVKGGSRIFTSAVVIGEKAGRSGTVEITGEGSRLEAAGVVIGGEGIGVLTVRDNAVVRAQTFEIGVEEGSSGEFRLEGAQTRFFLGQQAFGQATATVGGNGSGSLHVANGARILGNVTPIDVGAGRPGVEASFIVTGEGSGVEDVLVRVTPSARFEIRDKASADQIGLDVLAGGTALLDDAAVASPHIVSAGRVTIRGGADVIASRVDIPAGGRVEVFGVGTKLRDFEAFVVTGVLDVRDGAEVIAGSSDFGPAEINFGSQGVLTGSGGTVRATVFVSEGRVSPGQSPGILTIDGDLTLGAGATLTLEIAGLAPGAQYDQLVVTGDFTLEGGTIELSFLGGFAPRAGETFTFFDVGGAFDSDAVFAVSGLEEGWEFETAFDPETGTFGLVSLNDGIAAIPEPATLALLAAAAGVLTLARKLRHRTPPASRRMTARPLIACLALAGP